MGVCGAQEYSLTMRTVNPLGDSIYQLRAVLRGISPLIWRRLLVRSDTTIAQLHEILQVAFGWEDIHLHRFQIHGREYGLNRDGGAFFSSDARQVHLCDLGLRRLERFTYEYDFGDYWLHDLRIEVILPVESRKTYPSCVAGKCAAPPEDCGGAGAFMANRWRYSAVSNGMSGEDREELFEELDDEEWEIERRYDPNRFDRRQVNRALAQLAAISTQGGTHEIHDSAVD